MSSDINITRNNYEIFFLDFHEGRLSAGLRRELTAFLDANPDLKEEFYSFDGPGLANESGQFPGRNTLYRDYIPVGNIHPGNVDEMIIASMENDLTDEAAEFLDQFIGLNPAYGVTRELYEATRLVPPVITFPGKRALKKGRRRGMVVFMTSVAAAATVFLFIFLGHLIEREPGGESLTAQQQITTLPMIGPSLETRLPQPVILPGRSSASDSWSPRSLEKPVEREYFANNGLAPMKATAVQVTHEPFVSRYLISRYEGTESAEILLTAWSDDDTPGSRSMAGRILAGLFRNAREMAVAGKKEDSRKDFSIWTLADIGIRSYNTLADRDINLETNKDDETGKVRSYLITENEEILRTGLLKQDP